MFSNFTSRINHIKKLQPIQKRMLFTQIPPATKAYGFEKMAATATAVATILTHDKELPKEEHEKQIAKTEEVFANHVSLNRSSNLLEAAIILNRYEAHAVQGTEFFRGEKLPKNVIDDIDKNLGTIVELTKDTSITTSHNVAIHFSKPPLLDTVVSTFFNSISNSDRNTKKFPVFYSVDIHKNFKFIKIPNNTYIDYTDETLLGYHSESEYILPKGTRIIISQANKTPTDNPKHRHYIIHVVPDNL